RQLSLHDKILVPVLGGHYGTVLERGEIALRYNPATAALDFWYADHRFPLSPRHYAAVLAPLLENPETPRALRMIIEGFATPGRQDMRRLQDALVRLTEKEPALLAAIEATVARYAGTPGDRTSFIPLHSLLERQHYRPAYWRVAADEINFRRFFDINE